MYSPTQQEFNLESTESFATSNAMDTPHSTVGAVPVARNSRFYNGPYPVHQRQGSFPMSPSSAAAGQPGRNAHFGDPNAQNWFGTSLDSATSSFGQSPSFSREITVTPSTSASHVVDNYPGEDDEAKQKDLQEIFEKRRKRRESHNAVERRRRDNINERIQELCGLLPERLLETAPTSANVMTVTGSSGGPTRAINKGTILKLSVEHIKELQVQVYRYQTRVKELETIIQAAKNGEMIPQEVKLDLQQSPLPSQPGQEFATRQTPSQSHQPVRLMGSGIQHERLGPMQFQQRFGNIQITQARE